MATDGDSKNSKSLCFKNLLTPSHCNIPIAFFLSRTKQISNHMTRFVCEYRQKQTEPNRNNADCYVKNILKIHNISLLIYL